MKEFDICRVNPQYLRFLQNYDKNVPQKNHRPYIVITLDINNKKYAIPLTSKRLRANGKKRNPLTTTELIGKNNIDYGAILYNNMIPISEHLVTKINFKSENIINRELLKDKAILIKRNSQLIRKKAITTYNIRISEKNKFMNEFCANFKLLEEKLKEYTLQQSQDHNQEQKPLAHEQTTQRVSLKEQLEISKARVSTSKPAQASPKPKRNEQDL